MSNQNEPLSIQSSGIYVQTEKSYCFTTAQLKLLAGDLFDHIVEYRLPPMLVWVLSLSTSVFSFCLPFKITKTEIKGFSIFSENLIRSVVSWIFIASILAIALGCILVFIHILRNRRLTISRHDAIVWFSKTARKRCRRSIPIDPKNGVPLQR